YSAASLLLGINLGLCNSKRLKRE
ncbi:hypothetical protein Q604_UNBC15024G0002, partial [human gut metagenome]